MVHREGMRKRILRRRGYLATRDIGVQLKDRMGRRLSTRSPEDPPQFGIAFPLLAKARDCFCFSSDLVRRIPHGLAFGGNGHPTSSIDG